MKQEIQIADKPTLDEIKELLENSGYGLEALKTLIGSSGGGGGWYKPIQSLAVSGTQTLSFYGRGKLRFFTNAQSVNVTITHLDIDGLANHMANVASILTLSTKELEFDSKCIITLNCGGAFAFIYYYQYVTA